MSFILDALKKSETDRQQRSSAEFSKVPASSGPGRAPRWLLVLGILLAVNLVVLLGLFLRPAGDAEVLPSRASGKIDHAPATELRLVEPEATQAPDDPPSFARQVAEAKSNRPPASETGVAPPTSVPQRVTPLPDVNEERPRQTAGLPTIYEVVANGSIVLPELHLDIHVYSEAPADRFVFINMSKQREKSQLSEGPLVEEITPDGVVLAYRGKSFLLPRD
jgi:general secretion pathway protein B